MFVRAIASLGLSVALLIGSASNAQAATYDDRDTDHSVVAQAAKEIFLGIGREFLRLCAKNGWACKAVLKEGATHVFRLVPQTKPAPIPAVVIPPGTPLRSGSGCCANLDRLRK